MGKNFKHILAPQPMSISYSTDNLPAHILGEPVTKAQQYKPENNSTWFASAVIILCSDPALSQISINKQLDVMLQSSGAHRF